MNGNEFLIFQRHIISKRIIRSIEQRANGIYIDTDDGPVFFFLNKEEENPNAAMDYLLRVFNKG